MMSLRNILLGMGMLFISISCSHDAVAPHVGEYKIDRRIVLVDSIVVSADSTSGRGNFFMQDSSIYFADSYYMSVFQYNYTSSSSKECYFRKGQGPNEVSSFYCAYPFRGKNEEVFMLDVSMGMYTYRKGEYTLSYNGIMDFGWDKLMKNDYDSPSVYRTMEMTDFGISLTYLNDSTVLLPVSLINRHLDGITAERYQKGHIFGELNLNNMKIDKVFGHFPNIYRNKPTPFLEFFQYDMYHDTLYVNHAVDSLIYVYKYPDQLLYTMGYEVADVNRDYTIGYENDMSKVRNDMQEVGTNTGLLYVPEMGLLLRTTMKSFKDKKVALQVYSGHDLVSEAGMPGFFKLLGYWNGYLYGTQYLPLEDDKGNVQFVFYRFKIESL